MAPQSRDLASATLLLAGAGLFAIFGDALVQFPFELLQKSYSATPWLSISMDEFVREWRILCAAAFGGFLVYLLLLPIALILISMIQTRFLIATSKLKPSLKNISIFEGVARLFSWDSTVVLLLGILKIGLIVSFVFWICAAQIPLILSMYHADLHACSKILHSILLGFGLKISLALFVLALFDYAWQYYRHEQRLKMTFEQLREEIRSTERAG